ncbi:MAG: 50S ribosomal protein L20, partial [bacterium]|nr:50S ribosomal protein L20 [bacterium]
AALRAQGISYSRFIDLLKKQNIELDRKVLATLANTKPALFKMIVEKVRALKSEKS